MDILTYVDGIYNHIVNNEFTPTLELNRTNIPQIGGSYAIYNYNDIVASNIGILEHEKIKNNLIPLKLKRITIFDNILEGIELIEPFKISCNVAECLSIYTLLKDLKNDNIKYNKIIIFTDSQSVINKFNNKSSCSNYTMDICYNKINELLEHFNNVQFNKISGNTLKIRTIIKH